MTNNPTNAILSKEALKALREERKEWIAAASAASRESRKALKAVRERLAQSSASIPEIAASTGLPPDKALWLVATMKKFGEIAEQELDDGYYRYALIAKDVEDAPDQAE